MTSYSMYKSNFKISSNCCTKLNQYGTLLNLPIQTIMRYIVTEQINRYIHTPELFNQKFLSCKPKEAYGTTNAYGVEKLPKSYSMEVTEYIYTYVQSIKQQYNAKTNVVVNNLLHIGINEILANFDVNYATPYKELTANTKQYSIPLSLEFTERLQAISNITVIKINQLISLIIGNFLIKHYIEYDNNIYMTEKTMECYYDVW